jgi:Bacterial Ig-like domain
MLQRFVDPAAVEAEIDRVWSLSGQALRRRWQAVFTGAVTAFSGLMIDTTPPPAPVITGDAIVNANEVALTGTAADLDIAGAGDLVYIYEGTSLLGTTTTNATTGSWSYTTGPLSTGTYGFTATVTDAAGNTSAASQAVDPAIPPAATAAMILRNGTNGDYEIYDIGSNAREWPDLGSPGSRPRSFDTCQVLRPRRAAKPCDFVLGCVAFRLRNSVGAQNFGFRGSMAGLCPPL